MRTGRFTSLTALAMPPLRAAPPNAADAESALPAESFRSRFATSPLLASFPAMRRFEVWAESLFRRSWGQAFRLDSAPIWHSREASRNFASRGALLPFHRGPDHPQLTAEPEAPREPSRRHPRSGPVGKLPFWQLPIRKEGSMGSAAERERTVGARGTKWTHTKA
jgi:hypothetical protein